MENWRAKRISGTWAAAVALSMPAITPTMAAATAPLPLGIGFAFLISSCFRCLRLGSLSGWVTLGITRAPWLAAAVMASGWCRLALRGGNEGIAQGADPGNGDFDDVTCLEVGRGPVRSHPNDVAGMERDVARDGRDIGGDAEQHGVGFKARRLAAVDRNARFQPLEVDVGFDPRTHGLEGVGVFGSP